MNHEYIYFVSCYIMYFLKIQGLVKIIRTNILLILKHCTLQIYKVEIYHVRPKKKAITNTNSATMCINLIMLRTNLDIACINPTTQCIKKALYNPKTQGKLHGS